MTTTLWIIVGTDAEGDTEYWNNGYGWVEHRQDASAFTDDERASLALPIGGKWEPLE